MDVTAPSLAVQSRQTGRILHVVKASLPLLRNAQTPGSSHPIFRDIEASLVKTGPFRPSGHALSVSLRSVVCEEINEKNSRG